MIKVAPYAFPTVATLRPCTHIAAEALTGDAMFATVADRFSALTTELPLAGGSAMRPTSSGSIALIDYLRAAAPWCETAIARLESQLRIQLWAGRPWLGWRPMLLVGGPGVGKSHFANLIARFSGCAGATLDLGGTSDSRLLEGTARGWSNAQPCWPSLMMAQTRTANPILTLEEADKAGGSSHGGTPHSVLLTMIERQTAERYWDKCLLAQVNLSAICWILTSNDAGRLPSPLLSRLDVCEVEGPSAEHFELMLTSMMSDLAHDWNVPLTSMPTLPRGAVNALEKAFVRSRSARQMRRHLELILSTLVSATSRLTQ